MFPSPTCSSSRGVVPVRSGSRCQSVLLALWLGGAGMGATGCGSQAVRAAESGNLPELRKAIASELRTDDLDEREAREIARLVASREVSGAAGAVGADRVRAFASCARPIDEALEERAAVRDLPGAAAAMARVEAGLADEDTVAEHAAYARAAEGSILAEWRAVGARSLVGPDDAALRRKLVLDGDERVRLAALRAAYETPHAGDAAALLEAARLDPLPLARTMAIRATGLHGGDRVVLALKDAWPLADEPAKEAIADAWATPASLDAGGRRELLWATDTQRGSPSIAAAYALVRVGGAGKNEGLGVLTRAIATGPTKDRLYAIAVAPLDAPPVRDAVRKAQDDTDQAVALAAVGRALEARVGGATGKERARLIGKLLKAAQGGTTQALAAKATLARAEVRQVVPILAKDVTSRDDRLRTAAGEGLAALGELPRASIAAADAQPHVRVAVACAILRAPNRD
jgi:hypothetical protein